jgi:hypothetical protein
MQGPVGACRGPSGMERAARGRAAGLGSGGTWGLGTGAQRAFGANGAAAIRLIGLWLQRGGRKLVTKALARRVSMLCRTCALPGHKIWGLRG